MKVGADFKQREFLPRHLKSALFLECWVDDFYSSLWDNSLHLHWLQWSFDELWFSGLRGWPFKISTVDRLINRLAVVECDQVS